MISRSVGSISGSESALFAAGSQDRTARRSAACFASHLSTLALDRHLRYAASRAGRTGHSATVPSGEPNLSL